MRTCVQPMETLDEQPEPVLCFSHSLPPVGKKCCTPSSLASRDTLFTNNDAHLGVSSLFLYKSSTRKCNQSGALTTTESSLELCMLPWSKRGLDGRQRGTGWFVEGRLLCGVTVRRAGCPVQRQINNLSNEKVTHPTKLWIQLRQM